MVIAYIEEIENKKYFKKVDIRKFDNNYIIAINLKDEIKIKKKLIKYILKFKINALIFSKSLERKFELEFKEYIAQKNINIEIINGKKVMEFMQFDILQYIMEKQGTDMKQENIFIVFKSEKNLRLNFFTKFIENFKMTNIVTNEVAKFRNIQDNLLENENILISVSNNKRKALKRAKYILNINLKKEELEKYNINRNAIIINVRENIIFDNLNFDGININNINIKLSDECIEKFEMLNNKYDIKKIYESILLCENIRSMDVEKIYEKIKKDEVQVKEIIGNNGVIEDEELFKNKSMYLDKKLKLV